VKESKFKGHLAENFNNQDEKGNNIENQRVERETHVNKVVENVIEAFKRKKLENKEKK